MELPYVLYLLLIHYPSIVPFSANHAVYTSIYRIIKKLTNLLGRIICVDLDSSNYDFLPLWAFFHPLEMCVFSSSPGQDHRHRVRRNHLHGAQR